MACHVFFRGSGLSAFVVVRDREACVCLWGLTKAPGVHHWKDPAAGNKEKGVKMSPAATVEEWNNHKL